MTVAQRKQAQKSELKLSKKLEKHRGQWVAIRDASIVEHADTLNDLLSRIEPEGVDRIMRVARDKVAVSFF